MAGNFTWQHYSGIQFKLIDRRYGKDQKAKRFVIRALTRDALTNQNVWIPNKHLMPDGTLKSGEDIDYVFRKAQRQLELAGHLRPIPGIKRTSEGYVRPEDQPLPWEV